MTRARRVHHRVATRVSARRSIASRRTPDYPQRQPSRRLITAHKRAVNRQRYDKQRAFYLQVRAQMAHPDNDTKCAYCGEREHSALHHEVEFERAGTGITMPASMTPPQLAAEVKRCTREDGTIGLVSVCLVCHYQAKHTGQRSTQYFQKSVTRNRRLDLAAKLIRGECECDEKCERAVTAQDADMFEWDHLVQACNDPSYRVVGNLVSSGASAARCERERAKCRLLYFQCHRRHSKKQRKMAD